MQFHSDNRSIVWHKHKCMPSSLIWFVNYFFGINNIILEKYRLISDLFNMDLFNKSSYDILVSDFFIQY